MPEAMRASEFVLSPKRLNMMPMAIFARMATTMTVMVMAE